MAGNITHKWTGATLTVTSDSGASSANLQGPKGDMGPRGPQGPAGVVYNQDGEIVMEGFATEEYVNHLIDNIDLTDYATKTDVENAISAIPEPDWSAYATKQYVTEQIDAIPETDLTGLATEDYVDEAIAAIPAADLTGLASTEYVDEKVQEAIDAIPDVDFTGYATENYVDEKVNEAIEAIPDIDWSGIATENYVNEQIAAIPEPDFTGYATEDYVAIEIAKIPTPNLDNYATKDYVDITSTTALSNYYTRDEVDEVIANLEPGTGGGGGGATNNAVLTMKNTSGWLYKVVATDSDCIISGTWSSLEDGLATGNGVLTAQVNGVTKYSVDVPQGSFTFNVAPYLTVGTNTVSITITDIYTNSRTVKYTVEQVSVSLSSTFEKDGPVEHTGAISYNCVPVGNVEKRLIYILDGKVIGTADISTSGRQVPFTIPAQKHGSHTFEVYFTSVISGTTVESNHLVYDLICTETGNNTPIISVANNRLTMTQFETANIYYTVFSPGSLTTDIELVENNKVVRTLTVDRTQQPWDYRADAAGSQVLKIRCLAPTGETISKSIYIGVNAADMGPEAVTNDLELYLSSYGRSNQETTPATWNYGDIVCGFENYNWKSDGWVKDDNDMIVHRITGDARLTIPYKAFGSDARTYGKTIEIEFATRDTLNYDAVIASCMSDGIGFEMTPQRATIKSEQAAIHTQYKENEHIRLSFVIEKRAENRLVYTYLNGIMCGAVQYEDNDNFAQSFPVDITLGSNEATLDIYTIRVYNNSLTRYDILDNWIADTKDINERFNKFKRNDIYDAYGNIIISKLPKDLPYLILDAPILPQAKDNPTPVVATYVNPEDETKNFTYEATADVQGTSSAGYVRKNYIIEYPETYKLREDSIPTNIFTYKADVASSEGANNVELVRLYNNISPYKTPPQAENAKVRQGIDGFPIVVFHNDGNGAQFIGKYNFNNDKETPEVFGFAPGDESWEIRNNTSNRVIFKDADFTSEDWLNDFKARYPEKYKDATRLAAFAAWVASTDTTGCSEAEKAARLEKFRTELPQYAEVQSALFYYLFTELFLMVDSRAKNAFPTWFGEDGKVCWLPYDMDTAMGINNEGALVFGYELEDTDTLASGAKVYNGQDSVFWNNLRDTYGEELQAMYKKLRDEDKTLSYSIVEDMFEAHQSKWPEAIWNEDAWFKYLQPLVESNNGSYLGMLQGSKEEQRKWWLYNRFRYMDSKYNAGDALTDFIMIRGYEKSDISIKPYADIYASILYGSYLVSERALRREEAYTLECPLDALNDTEIFIYSASQLKDVGDLSGLKVGYADFTQAAKLQNLKLGSSAAGYSNGNLVELYLGNNTLLQTIDVRNCPALGSGEKQQAVNLSGCTNIEHVYFDGTTIKGCTLPNGGILKTLHLPSTITNLTILNQKALTELVVPSYANISTLRLENVSSSVDAAAILSQIKAGSRVRLLGLDMTFDKAADIEAFYDRLDTMKGLDENNNNLDKAQVSGRIYISNITSDELERLQNRYTHITIIYESIAHKVTYVNYDGNVLYEYVTPEGQKAIDPVGKGLISTPTRASTEGYTYSYSGWNSLPVITGDTTITATYKATVRYYTASFVANGQVVQTASVPYGSTARYTGTTPVAPSGATNTLFAGWYPTPGTVTKNVNYQALFASDSKDRTEITDSWATILASIDDGTYASKYHRGMYKKANIYGKDINLYIAGFSVDKMANGNLAPITWTTSAYVTNNVQWHSDNTSTESLAWSTCDLRKFVANSIAPTIQSDIRSRIVPVQKTHMAYDVNSNHFWQTTTDSVWVPSVKEYFNGQTYDGTNVISNKVSMVNMSQTTYADSGWLRDKPGPLEGLSVADNPDFACSVGQSGGHQHKSITSSYAQVYIGFAMA